MNDVVTWIVAIVVMVAVAVWTAYETREDLRAHDEIEKRLREREDAIFQEDK